MDEPAEPRVPIFGAGTALTANIWVRGRENGRQVWTCEACSREHLRSIEGKLDTAWW